MIAFARLAVFGFLALSVIYLGVSLYSRSVRRGKLRVWWEEEGRPGDRDAHPLHRGAHRGDARLFPQPRAWRDGGALPRPRG